MNCPCCNNYVYKCDTSPFLKNFGWFQKLHHCMGCGGYFTLVGGKFVEESLRPRPVKYPEEATDV